MCECTDLGRQLYHHKVRKFESQIILGVVDPPHVVECLRHPVAHKLQVREAHRRVISDLQLVYPVGRSYRPIAVRAAPNTVFDAYFAFNILVIDC